MAMKIESAKQAADTIEAMDPAKVNLLIQGLRIQHPHLRDASDSEIRAMLREFVANNKAG